MKAATDAASDEFGDELELVRHLQSHYPGDPGIVVAMLLNLVILRRGQGVDREQTEGRLTVDQNHIIIGFDVPEDTGVQMRREAAAVHRLVAKDALMDFDKALELFEPVLGFEVHVEGCQ